MSSKEEMASISPTKLARIRWKEEQDMIRAKISRYNERLSLLNPADQHYAEDKESILNQIDQWERALEPIDY